MKIIFSNVPILQRRLIKKLFAKALETTSNADNQKLYVGLKFVSEQEINLLNKQHRNIDKVTDVLSFPMLDIKWPQKLSDFEDQRDPDGSLNIGDIAVCTKKAALQAKEYGNTYKRELAFLSLHGFLHLLGFDHIEKEEEKTMMALAEGILSQLKLKRSENV